mgnify:CR=1 FL=1
MVGILPATSVSLKLPELSVTVKYGFSVATSQPVHPAVHITLDLDHFRFVDFSLQSLLNFGWACS